MLACHEYVGEQQRMKGQHAIRDHRYVADGTHEAHVVPMLRDARVTLLEFANPVRRQLRYPYRPHPGIGINLLGGRRLAHSSPWTMGMSFPLEAMTTSRSQTASQPYPRARRGSTRVHRGKVYGAPDEYTLGSLLV